MANCFFTGLIPRSLVQILRVLIPGLTAEIRFRIASTAFAARWAFEGWGLGPQSESAFQSLRVVARLLQNPSVRLHNAVNDGKGLRKADNEGFELVRLNLVNHLMQPHEIDKRHRDSRKTGRNFSSASIINQHAQHRPRQVAGGVKPAKSVKSRVPLSQL